MYYTNTTGTNGYPVSLGHGVKRSEYEGIIAKIVQEVEDRTRKDIQDWRQAQDAAANPENPRWQPLQDLYEYLSTDGHLRSQTGIRKGAVLSHRFYIRDSKTGKEDKDKTKLLQKRWFLFMLSDILDNLFRAYTVLQIPEAKRIPSMSPLEDKYFMVPRRNFIPQSNIVLAEVFGEVGYSITDPAWNNTIVCVKSMDQFGLMNYIVPDLIWKRNARQGWAIFSERFGIPLVKIETNRTQKKDIDALEIMAKKMGQAARAVMPTGSKMDIIDSATKGDPYKVYLEQINLGNDEISKVILGGTMISDDGSSRSQSEVHERTLDDKVTAMDLMDIEFTVNDQILPILRQGDWPFDDNDEFVFDRSESLSLDDHWKIVKEAMQEGYEMDEQWVRETFDLKIVGKKEPVKVDPKENFNEPSEEEEQEPAASGGVVWPLYMISADECCNTGSVFTAQGNDAGFRKLMEQLQEQILRNIFDGNDTTSGYLSKAIAVGSKYREAMYNGWGDRRLEINYNATDHVALAKMEMNLFTFSSLREKASIVELNNLLIDKEGNRLREFSEFKKAAQDHLGKLNERWLETEYNFAVAVGQGASRYHQYLSEAKTVTKFLEYVTVGDKRVRTEHQLLHGLKFSIDDPEARRLWPPNDWGCRCEFVQYVGNVSKASLTSGKEGMSLLGWTDKQKKVFGVNRGDTGQVFLQNQMYMKDEGLGDDVKAMTYDKYGLDSWASFRDDLNDINLDKTITTDNVSELFRKEPDTDYMGFKDHLNRSVILREKVFNEHTQTAKYTTGKERRHQLFGKLSEVLQQPDEVYLFDYKEGAYQFRYVKFYKDEVIIVPVKLGKTNMEISTWYPLKAKEKAQRNGLLIHNGIKKP